MELGVKRKAGLGQWKNKGRVTVSLIMDRIRFLAFIAMVVNCASEIETKSKNQDGGAHS